MVAFDSDLVIRHEIDRVLDAHDASAEIVMEFDNIETIKRALEIDAGFAILPEPTVLREVAAGTLACVRPTSLSGRWASFAAATARSLRRRSDSSISFAAMPPTSTRFPLPQPPSDDGSTEAHKQHHSRLTQDCSRRTGTTHHGRHAPQARPPGFSRRPRPL